MNITQAIREGAELYHQYSAYQTPIGLLAEKRATKDKCLPKDTIYGKMVTVLNIPMSKLKKEQRHRLISKIIGRDVVSSYHLTYGEVKAWLDQSQDSLTHRAKPEFLSYLKELNHE